MKNRGSHKIIKRLANNKPTFRLKYITFLFALDAGVVPGLRTNIV